MSNFLANKATIVGLSRNKIIAVAIIIIGVILILAFTSDGNESNNSATTKTDAYYIKSNNQNDVDNLLSKISTFNTTKTESVIPSADIPAITDNHSNKYTNNESVPDIETAEANKLKNSQTINMYVSPKGKSLMYSNKPNNTENTTNKCSNTNNADGTDVDENTSQYEVKAGSIISAVMLNGLNSELPGSIIALVRANVYDSITRTYLLIPQGAKLIGSYDSNVIYAQERVAVAWNRIIYPDGSSIMLKAIPGTDIEGYSGFYDKVDNHYVRLFGASFIMGVITGAMQYSQNNTNTSNSSGANPTVGQTMAGSIGQQMGQTGMAITQKNLNIAPTIVIRPNYPFSIIVTSDLRLKPFKKIN
ncbi:MAG: hypothetical protein K2P99_06570 [Burkholderiales bacterium]|nr:hypothetical protein [Burkholderiales bacterium]